MIVAGIRMAVRKGDRHFQLRRAQTLAADSAARDDKKIDAPGLYDRRPLRAALVRKQTAVGRTS